MSTVSLDTLPVAEPTEAARGASGGASTIGESILHHVRDGNALEFGPWSIELPQIHVLGVDLSITRHVVMMWIVAAVLLVVLCRTARHAQRPVGGRLRTGIELFIEFVRNDIARKAIPGHADRYVGYLLSTFFFILTCNLLGLVPGMSTATGNISVTAGLALVAFLQIHWGGIREYGLIGHLRHLAPAGVPAWLAPLMMFSEIVGSLIKPFALCVRLFANMMAGHVVILSFISMIFILKAFWYLAAPFAVAMALFVNLLEVLIALLQAYIFTMLTAQFIGMSVHPAH
jgi:F-type H+-transporting ATPase subunit a